ncbi:MAG: response regulator [Planctomycetes bacterium]|nr:response regulator [Planctomycetota bacterium]
MTTTDRFHVLVIDDNPGDIDLIELGFSDLSIPIRFSQAADGISGLQLIKELSASRSCPDLILLDLNMPKVNGFEVLESIRSLDLCARCMVVILTTSSAPADHARCLALGANRFETKPSTYDDLLRLIGLLHGESSGSSPAGSV